MAQDLWTLWKKKQEKSQPVHGPPMQFRVAAANRAVLATCVTILAHMVMNRGGNAEQNRGKNDTRAAGMGPRQRQAGKAWHDKAAVAKTAGR